MQMTKKFMKEWGYEEGQASREAVQRLLDGGTPISRKGVRVGVGGWEFPPLDTPARAVKFAAALNKLRRPLRLIKQDLDADWAARVKERDNHTCVGCGVKGDKLGGMIEAHTELDEETGESREVRARVKKDVLTAHHWLVTKARARMARWARPCGVTYHYAEHIHSLHENPCWVDLEPIYWHVFELEGEEGIEAARLLSKLEPTEARVRALWRERCEAKKAKEL